MTQKLELAAPGERIRGEELQASIAAMREIASDMDELMGDDLTVAELQAIGREQARMRALAGSLIDRQIDLLAGEARITAEHIDGAITFARDALRRIAERQARLAGIAAVIGFIGAVAAGDGKAIVQSAVSLKRALA